MIRISTRKGRSRRTKSASPEVGEERRNHHGAEVDGPPLGIVGQDGHLALERLDLEPEELGLFGRGKTGRALVEQLEKAALGIHLILLVSGFVFESDNKLSIRY